MSSAFKNYMSGPSDPETPETKDPEQAPRVEDFDLRLQMASMSRDEIIDFCITERRDLLERNQEMHKINLDLLEVIKELKKDA